MKKKWPPIRKRKRGGYVVDLRKVGGGQVPANTLEEAEALAQEKRDEHDRLGALAFSLTHRERLEAAELFQAIKEKLNNAVTPTQLLSYYIEHHGAVNEMRTVGQVYEELQKSQERKGLSDGHRCATRYTLGKFIDGYSDCGVGDITFFDLEKFLDEQGFTATVTKANNIRYLSLFFSFAKKRGYIEHNPVDRVDRPKVVKGLPKFITVEQVRDLLFLAQEKDSVMVPKLALGFFTGIRRDEMDRMDWSDISFANKLVTVRPEVAKASVPRHVTMSNNLVEWLLPHREQKGGIGLKKKAFNRHRRKLQQTAGVEHWPHSAMRKTFATHHLAFHEDAAKTAFELGHTQGVQLLYTHYRGLVTKSDAELFWELKPNDEKTVVSVSA